MNHDMRNSPSKQDQHEGFSLARLGIPRRVAVKGMGNVHANVVVTVVQETVWLSISPPFTWEAIMDPVKLDEMIHVLGLAREDIKKIAVAQGSRAPTRALSSQHTRGMGEHGKT
ncbi:MAG: hypothetical protein ACRDRB_14925 [Pseudonocardiaceae bacterium]